MAIWYRNEDNSLSAAVFIQMAAQVWPGDYRPQAIQQALQRTINITAWDGEKLVGCVRILSDGYLFGTIPELLVLKEYRGQGIGRELMRRAAELSPTSLYFGAQPVAMVFYEKLGLQPSLPSFQIKKKRQ